MIKNFNALKIQSLKFSFAPGLAASCKNCILHMTSVLYTTLLSSAVNNNARYLCRKLYHFRNFNFWKLVNNEYLTNSGHYIKHSSPN